MKLRYIINTVRYMNLVQIVYRIRYEIFKKAKKEVKYYKIGNMNNKYNFYLLNNNENLDYYRKNYILDINEANNILNYEFKFLNTLSYKFENGKIDWSIDPFNYRLWNFNLNYFDFLEILLDAYIVTNNKNYLDFGYKLIDRWIKSNIKKYDSDIWDPYVVAKRIVNWTIFFSFCDSIMDINNKQELDSSINSQMRYLYKNIEYYLQANHVIMDAKGMIFSGIYLNDYKVVRKGIEVLKKEYVEQILNDGGHYERSTSYHVEVLQHYFECAILLKRNKYTEYEVLMPMIEVMFQYLNNIVMPNGDIPLLNDSSLEYPINAQDLLQSCILLLENRCSKPNVKSKFSKYAFKFFGIDGKERYHNLKAIDNVIPNNIINNYTGYYIVKDNIKEQELYLLFDCGDNGPDYNLGHTHADNLNVILTIGEKEVFLDSGTYTYKKSKERNYFRSTKAHNTITIDNKSSSEIWSAFRVAKRAKSKVLDYNETEEYTYISAEHDGYSKVLNKDKIIHRRDIFYIKQKCIIIIDILYGRIENTHNVEINLYLGVKNILKINNYELSLFLNEDINLNINSNYTVETEKVEVSKYFNKTENMNKIFGNISISGKKALITRVDIEESLINVIEDVDEIKIYYNNTLIKSILY